MDRLAIIEAESQRFSDVLLSVDPGSRCPTCPEWSASDLLWHLTEVHFFWAGILSEMIQSEEGLPAIEESKPERPAEMAAIAALRAQATDGLVRQLASRDDAERCWSWWSADQSVGFTRRMQTYEATFHRMDAELTAGVAVGPIADDVAAGAIDHAVDVMWGWMPGNATFDGARVVKLVADDTGESWLVEVGSWSAPAGEPGKTVDGPKAVRATTGEPTATVSAPVAELALWAWTRGGTVQTSGDPVTIAALEAVHTQGMP